MNYFGNKRKQNTRAYFQIFKVNILKLGMYRLCKIPQTQEILFIWHGKILVMSERVKFCSFSFFSVTGPSWYMLLITLHSQERTSSSFYAVRKTQVIHLFRQEEISAF
jgi:hypothetical protein